MFAASMVAVQFPIRIKLINKSLHLLEEINRNLVGFGRDHILTAWWLAVIPAITIFLTTLSMSILGDWTRDKLDPTLK